MKTIIIPAGGHQDRWEQVYPKQLVDIFGQPLLTVTIMSANNIFETENIHILAWKKTNTRAI